MFLSTFLISLPVFADDSQTNSTNWGIQPKQKTQPAGEPSEYVWDKEEEEYIYDNYGSEYSPAFLNRQNMNPNESDYGYGSFDGLQ